MSIRTRALGATLAVAVALAALLAAPALAGVSRGTYFCSSGYQLKIKAHRHYKFSVGDGGKYRFKSGSHKIVFKSGYLAADWYGHYRHDTNTGTPIIELILKDHSGSDFCEK